MIIRHLILEDISKLPAANTAGTVLITAPRGYRYLDFTLAIGRSDAASADVPLATVGDIEARMGGGIQRRITATRLDALNTLNGAQFTSQYNDPGDATARRFLKMFCYEPWRTRIRTANVSPSPGINIDPMQLGWKTGWTPSTKPLQIAVSFPALGSGVTPLLEAYARVVDDDDGSPNAIIRWETNEANANSANVNITNIDNGLQSNDRIVQISGWNTTDGSPKTVSTVRMEVGSVVVHQDLPIAKLNADLRNADLDPASANTIANAAHLVFDINDALEDTLPVGFNSSLLKFGLSAASSATLPYVTQVFGAPKRS